MNRMNRQQRRELDRQVSKSISIINAHLDFLNQSGNPKYELKKMATWKWKLKSTWRGLWHKRK